MNHKVTALLGFARKAGKLALGNSACEKQIRCGRCMLTILAQDAARNTKDKFERLCEKANVPCIELMNMEQLGRAVGMDDKAVIAVCDQSFAFSIRKAAQCCDTENSEGKCK